MKELISFLAMILLSVAYSGIEQRVKARKKQAVRRASVSESPKYDMPTLRAADTRPSMPPIVAEEGIRVTHDSFAEPVADEMSSSANDVDYDKHIEKWRKALIAHEVFSTKF